VPSQFGHKSSLNRHVLEANQNVSLQPQHQVILVGICDQERKEERYEGERGLVAHTVLSTDVGMSISLRNRLDQNLRVCLLELGPLLRFQQITDEEASNEREMKVRGKRRSDGEATQV